MGSVKGSEYELFVATKTINISLEQTLYSLWSSKGWSTSSSFSCICEVKRNFMSLVHVTLLLFGSSFMGRMKTWSIIFKLIVIWYQQI